MNDKKLFFISLTILIFLISADTLAKLNSFYYYYPRVDMIMHFVGGFSVTGLVLSIFRYKKINNVYNIFFVLFLISIIWEFAEFKAGRVMLLNASFWSDTASDLLMDSVGGIIAYICFHKIKIKNQIAKK
jgi:hypothetical protein